MPIQPQKPPETHRERRARKRRKARVRWGHRAKVVGAALRRGGLRVWYRTAWFVSTRTGIAYVLLTSSVLWTSVGAYQIYAPAGFITAGIMSGIYGYLLGSE